MEAAQAAVFSRFSILARLRVDWKYKPFVSTYMCLMCLINVIYVGDDLSYVLRPFMSYKCDLYQ